MNLKLRTLVGLVIIPLTERYNHVENILPSAGAALLTVRDPRSYGWAESWFAVWK
jgi:hypothetical protein